MEDDKFQEMLTVVAEEITEILIEKLRDPRGVRAEDGVAAAAALAGCYLLKESGVDVSKLTPGSAIFVEEINELGPRLLTLMQRYAEGFGLNGEYGWDSEVPEEHKPKDTYSLIVLLETEVTEVFERFEVPVDVRAGLMALTTVRFIAESKNVLPEEIGKSIALTAMISGSKTVPPRV